MSIPTVPGSEIQVATPSRSVKLDAGALSAPARALGAAADARFRGEEQIAGAVEGFGGQLQRLSDDMERVHRARVAADADFRMRAAGQAFSDSLRGDQDEREWGGRATEVYDRVREEIQSSGRVPPSLRAEIDTSLRSWGQGLQIKAATMASVQSINRAEVAVRKSYDEAGRDGDGVGMANAVRLGRSSHLDPVAMDELEDKIAPTLAKTAIETGLATNPQGTYELLKSGASLPVTDQNGRLIVPKKVFDPKFLEGLTNTARVRAGEWQKTNAIAMLQQDADPTTDLVPEPVIRAKMKSGEIPEIFGRNLIAAQDRKINAQAVAADREEKQIELEAKRLDREAYNLVAARAANPTAWGASPEDYAKTLTEDAAGISDPALRQRALNDVARQLAAVKKTGETAERPIERSIYELINRDKQYNGAMLPLSIQPVEGDKVSGRVALTNLASVPVTWVPGYTTRGSTKFVHVPGGLAAVEAMKSDDEVALAFGKGATKESVIQAIEVHSARVHEEMRQWFKTPEGQSATFEQANARRQEIERPWVIDAVRRELASLAPARVSNREAYDSLPEGASYFWGDETIPRIKGGAAPKIARDGL